jgi:hypothetical protein
MIFNITNRTSVQSNSLQNFDLWNSSSHQNQSLPSTMLLDLNTNGGWRIVNILKN